MINPYLVLELRRAERIFRKAGQLNLAAYTHRVRGAMCDSRFPDETEACRLLKLANPRVSS